MRKAIVFLTAIMMLAVLASCNNNVESSLVELDVSVSCEQSRSLAIEASYTAASKYMYKAEALYSTGETIGSTGSSWYSAGNTSTGNLTIVLCAGYWRITVALADINGNILFVSDAQTKYVSPASSSLSVSLKPYTSGSGKIAFDLSFKAATTGSYGTGSITCTVEPSTGGSANVYADFYAPTAGETYTFVDTETLSPGLYTVAIKFQETGYVSGQTVTVQILNGQTTTISGNLGDPVSTT